MTDFEALYRSDPDPFEVGTSWYERRKEQVLLACLAEPRYGTAWDAAAGTGHLAAALAGRCDRVVASDIAPTSVRLVRDLTADLPQVVPTVNALPAVPSQAGSVDLVVYGEVLYYLSEEDRHATLVSVPASAREVVVMHWAHHPDDAWLSGREANRESGEVLEARGWSRPVHHVEDDFVLDTWVRTR